MAAEDETKSKDPLESITRNDSNEDDNHEVSERANSYTMDLESSEITERSKHLHPLQHKYVWWYTRRQKGGTASVKTQGSYEDNIKIISDFSTVEGFWVCYSHLMRPNSMPTPSDFHLFKDGIRPLWEDPSNKNGGKWIMRFKKGCVGRFWENLVMAFVGEQLDTGDNVCGMVLSVRFNEDLISVWNRNAPDSKGVGLLKDSIKLHAELPATYILEYKPHDMALKDMSSFRNTWVRG